MCPRDFTFLIVIWPQLLLPRLVFWIILFFLTSKHRKPWGHICKSLFCLYSFSKWIRPVPRLNNISMLMVLKCVSPATTPPLISRLVYPNAPLAAPLCNQIDVSKISFPKPNSWSTTTITNLLVPVLYSPEFLLPEKTKQNEKKHTIIHVIAQSQNVGLLHSSNPSTHPLICRSVLTGHSFSLLFPNSLFICSQSSLL